MVFGVHHGILPTLSLGLIPTIACSSFISSIKNPIHIPPTLHHLSLLTISPHLFNFSSAQAVCIDTGASCCIRNNNADFLTFAPSPSAILKGISSGLTIACTGTMKWTLLNDDGDEITIYIFTTVSMFQRPNASSQPSTCGTTNYFCL
jgi:hypothetical protein